MKLFLPAVALLLAAASLVRAEPADLVVHNGKVLTVDAKFTTAQAVAVRGGKVVAVGTDADVLKLKGPKTTVIDAGGTTVMPGLYDSHTHPVGAASSEVGDPIPLLRSIPEVLAFITARAAAVPEGKWIVIRYAFPTRLKEARFPTKAELDSVSPKHPVPVPRRAGGRRQQLRTPDVRRDARHQEPARRPGGEGREDRRADRHAPQRLPASSRACRTSAT